ncbi:hypothetical protein [Microbispora sp. ATCC PTA-5024]|nr:hypothetical protein [Microbispora sp. ATCC PTA-5024]
MTTQPIATRRIPWRGGPRLDEWTEQQYRTEQADYDDVREDDEL